MNWKIFAILAVLCTCLMAPSCSADPFRPPEPPPSPPAQGGTQEAGGASATGGLPVAVSGSSSIAGAAGASSSTSQAFDWPVCNKQAPRKLSPETLERYRRSLMPARAEPMHARPKASYRVLDLPDALWAPYAHSLNQRVGSCTGNAAIGWRVGQPWVWRGTLDPILLENYAESVYSDATRIDPFPGSWPPDDTGSDGESVMTVMTRRGLVGSWQTVYTFEGVQRALQSGPCIIGSNWHTSMFSPNACGQVDVSGAVEGGHEYVWRGVQYSTKRGLFTNSWDDDYGTKDSQGRGGYFWMTFGNIQKLLNEGADMQCGQAIGFDWPD